MSLLIFSNWSREDLHNSTVLKFEGLARSIEACVNEYFQEPERQGIENELSKDPIYKDYQAVLDSKSNDETLTTHTARALFRDPCIRVAGELSKVLMELAESIRNHHRCSPKILSDQLHEALQDLNTAIKSQPRLFLGSDHNKVTNMLTMIATFSNHKPNKDSGIRLSFVKIDSSALLEWKSKKVRDQFKESKSKCSRPTLSKNAITILEFSEALPFAAFASLLVETAARLDLVIEEVEELGRLKRFKEFKPRDEITVICESTPRTNTSDSQPQLISEGLA